MGLDPFSIAGIAMSGLGAIAQISQANSLAQQQAAAASRNAEAQYQELNARQQDAIDKASQEKSERAKQADRELAALRVVMGESGGLGTITAERLNIEAGASEGLDISRIEANRDRELAALERSKKAAQMGAQNAIEGARTQASNTAMSAVIGAAAGGIQIAGTDYRARKLRESQQQRIPNPPTR